MNFTCQKREPQTDRCRGCAIVAFHVLFGASTKSAIADEALASQNFEISNDLNAGLLTNGADEGFEGLGHVHAPVKMSHYTLEGCTK